MKEWTKKVSPERYLATWPTGPEAELARQLVSDSTIDPAPDDVGPVRFFSPKSQALSVVVVPKEWTTQTTPGGSRTIQSPGKTAQFENNVYITDDPEVIDYLTTSYKDKRYPIVRDDVQTASAHRY